MTGARDVNAKLEGVKKQGGGWIALCPAHDDHKQSLSVTEKDGKILTHCHAGCTPDQVWAALKIETNGNGRREVATYDYRDKDGALLYQSVRIEPKAFYQRRPDGKGGFINNLNGGPRVLYRLPELLKAKPQQTIVIVEGEKDADRLAALGLVATTNSGGAGKWRTEYNEALRDRKVVILPDNDGPGRKHAQQVATALQDVTASVKVVELPGLPDKGDASDWLDAGGDVAELRKLVLTAKEYEGEVLTPPETSLKVVRMADVEREEVEWLWPPYIPMRKVTLIDGDPGVGKSWITDAIASAVTRGRGLPGMEAFEPGNVLIFQAEDGLADTLRPRLDALGADVSRVFALNQSLTFDEKGFPSTEEALIEYKARMLTIDPVFAFTGGKVDIHRANECRTVTARLALMAEKHNCAIVAVRHLGKSRGMGHALNAGIGSIDLAAAARSVLLVGKDPEDDNKRAITQIKSNLAPPGPAIGYTLRGGEFFWTGESDLTAERILSYAPSESERPALAEACEFLRDELSAGECDAAILKTNARKAGISEVTLRRAKERLTIKVKKVGFTGKWIWFLPDSEGDHLHGEGDQKTGDDHLRVSNGDKSTYDNSLAEGDHGNHSDHLRKPFEPEFDEEWRRSEWEKPCSWER